MDRKQLKEAAREVLITVLPQAMTADEANRKFGRGNWCWSGDLSGIPGRSVGHPVDLRRRPTQKKI